jgi:hypothetical protein
VEALVKVLVEYSLSISPDTPVETDISVTVSDKSGRNSGYMGHLNRQTVQEIVSQLEQLLAELNQLDAARALWVETAS